MAEGFNLELEDYCSHCGYFEPDVERMEVTAFGDSAQSYITTIKCKNSYKCARIADNLKKRID